MDNFFKQDGVDTLLQIKQFYNTYSVTYCCRDSSTKLFKQKSSFEFIFYIDLFLYDNAVYFDENIANREILVDVMHYNRNYFHSTNALFAKAVDEIYNLNYYPKLKSNFKNDFPYIYSQFRKWFLQMYGL